MNKPFFLALLYLGYVNELPAQTAMDSVKQTINHLFTSMKNGDEKGVLECFADSAIMQTIARDKSGETVVKDEIVYRFAALMGNIPKNSVDERIVFDVVKVDGALAMAWTPYRFYRNGQFSHCGTNAFQLVKIKDKWKIQYLIDTRRKQGCE